MSERTEQPTPRKLQEARKEGQVARSIELNAAVAMVAGVWLLSGPGGDIVKSLGYMIVDSLEKVATGSVTTKMITEVFGAYSTQLMVSFGMLVLGILFVGVVTTVGQTGLLWTSKNIGFNFKRVNPINGIKRIFSTQGLADLVKALLKIVVIAYITYAFIKPRISELVSLSQLTFPAAVSVILNTAKDLAIQIGMVYFVIAVADYAFQRWQHMKNLKMTKEEIKEEMKQREGDPYIKQRMRAKQRRMAMARMMANVHKSDVVLVNPTHLAIAIQYDQDSMNAPQVLAKGADNVAKRIVELAKENNIPVHQNIPLARAIYKTVEIGQEIPSELYLAMAEVLAYVFNLKKGKKVRKTPRI